MDFQTGSLVRVHNRDWVVQPSADKDLFLLKPLGGTDQEIKGLYLPLHFSEDTISSTNFPIPSKEDIGDISSARLLFNAARLAIRNGAGPFRCLGKLSFRPRSYQMVPLIMALKQEDTPIRLLIADDVGVGKTIEGLLILKELLDRKHIERFAVICLPHLCDQWQTELQDKFGIQSVVIRSNTQARLDREIIGDTSVFRYYPHQVISVDFIKSEQRRQVFINDCPDLIIVDEAHTCSRPGGPGSSVQQQRYALIRDIAAKPNQHVILMTATPHSGKQEQFQSLLGLLHSDFSTMDVPSASKPQRERLAKHFIQRRRKDVQSWLGQDTKFPYRDSGECAYDLSPSYTELYDQVFDFALGLTKVDETHEGKKRMRYWSALALLRGVMSSPAAGIDMLTNRLNNIKSDEDAVEPETNPIMDEDFDIEKDFPSSGVITKTDWNSTEVRKLQFLSKQMEELANLDQDHKANTALKVIKDWLNQGFNPIVFCRYIATANYLGEIWNKELAGGDEIDVQVITSEDPDEVRKARIDEMKHYPRRLLIATDCLSEGINLQDLFTAVLHYDLPWNPNRLEQREGRIDRFGQQADTVKCYLLYGKDNPIDGVVLKVLLEKVRQIRQEIGISIPFPEDSRSLMDSVLQAVILKGRAQLRDKQVSFDFFDKAFEDYKGLEITKEFEKAAEREKQSRSIFAQHGIKAEEIEQDLHQADDAIGDPAAVEKFVVEALTSLLDTQITRDKKAYVLFTDHLPGALKSQLPDVPKLKVSFYSPVPDGYHYLGRNHPLVEQLCRSLMAHAMNKEKKQGPARAAVIKCRDVGIKTTLLLYRVRNVIEEKGTGRQIVAEEVIPLGYQGLAQDFKLLENKYAAELMFTVTPTDNVTAHAAAEFLNSEIVDLEKIKENINLVAYTRAESLVESHERYRKVLGGTRFKTVEPILPMDLLGIYILLPDDGRVR